MPFEPEDVTSQSTWEVFKGLLDGRWLAILQHPCSFPPDIFEAVTLNLIRNPNINSSLLFRADILFDSHDASKPDEDAVGSRERALEETSKFSVPHDGFPDFTLKRTIVRRMVPRNPQLDKAIVQTCQIYQSSHGSNLQNTVVVYIPHVASSSEIPWYHPNVQSLAYLHTYRPSDAQGEVPDSLDSFPSTNGTISVHYRLFPDESFPLSDRLFRTAHHLLSTLHKHGQGILDGYTKRVLHDQIISQRRVQDTYTRLKASHAKRLCDHWAEQTDSSKHVFEDLGIAAFLIELWKDMYKPEGSEQPSNGPSDSRPGFPGFVDIGCGNGVLVDILLQEGYEGWGFDARNRKSWAIFEDSTQRHLHQLILVPQVLLDMTSDLGLESEMESPKFLSKILPKAISPTKGRHITVNWHSGIFPEGTFIISNHADELTPWTPLLAHISLSPFLMIPCCSHNLSGLRFRAPSKFNGYSADTNAPPYFKSFVTKSKSVPITTAATDGEDEQPISGNLRDLRQENRSKQPSAYAALCDWVSGLAVIMGYEVEKEMLRLPSTRNTGLIGRKLAPEARNMSAEQRMKHVMAVAMNERADGAAWVERARGLMAGKGEKH
ncbi:MAG: hypothetical protein LQ338_003893 [Usnochroma carphineum]|nr:MAG: hypothetical protein LQ338_003893 [Usnochroma carphineum]